MIKLIRNNKKIIIIKAKVLQKKAWAKQDGWSLREGALVHHGQL